MEQHRDRNQAIAFGFLKLMIDSSGGSQSVPVGVPGNMIKIDFAHMQNKPACIYLFKHAIAFIQTFNFSRFGCCKLPLPSPLAFRRWNKYSLLSGKVNQVSCNRFWNGAAKIKNHAFIAFGFFTFNMNTIGFISTAHAHFFLAYRVILII